MAETEEIGSGVAAVFEGIASGVKDKQERQEKPKKRRSREAKELTAALQEYRDSNVSDEARPKARIGRFPGTKNSNEPKERISARITAGLKDAYVTWSITEQCSLGNLMERALIEFYEVYGPETKRVNNSRGKT